MQSKPVRFWLSRFPCQLLPLNFQDFLHKEASWLVIQPLIVPFFMLIQ